MWARRGTRSVFYRSVRVNGRPTKVYVGTGPAAVLAAVELECRRHLRDARRAALRNREEQGRAEDRPVDELCAAIDAYLGAVLLAHGYHRHDRGPWRKRREQRV